MSWILSKKVDFSKIFRWIGEQVRWVGGAYPCPTLVTPLVVRYFLCVSFKGEKAGLRYSTVLHVLRLYSTCTPLYSACTPLYSACTPLVLHSYSTVLRLYSTRTPEYWSLAFSPLVSLEKSGVEREKCFSKSRLITHKSSLSFFRYFQLTSSL